MRRLIAIPVQRDLAADNEIGANAVYLDGTRGEATAPALCGALAEHRPGLVVTTSHGKTGPLADPAAMLRDLGLPVDVGFGLVTQNAVLNAWEPDGAIWYAHACCSAGNDEATIFRGLLEPGSPVDRLLEGSPRLVPTSPHSRRRCSERPSRCVPSSAMSSRRSTGRSG